MSAIVWKRFGHGHPLPSAHGWNCLGGERDDRRAIAARNRHAEPRQRLDGRLSPDRGARLSHCARRRHRAAHEHATRRAPLHGRELDLAIVGDGTFRVRDSTGRVATTRAGAFVAAADGTLRDAQGRTLLGLHGPVHAEGARVDERTLALPAGSRVQHGFLETAGVDAIAEMVDVLAAERSFESAQKAVAAIDSARQKSAEAARIK
jgi:flagellar basal body rod protein FlgG